MAAWLSLREALAPVADGTRLAIGGMTLYRRPVAAALEIAQRGVRGLDVTTLTAGIECDLLIGAGCIATLRSCYTGLEIAGLAPHFTRAAKARTLRIVEETEYTLSYAVQAAAMKVPFLPMLDSLGGTDIPASRPDLKRFDCPLTGQSLIAVPALRVDVALIHAAAADEHGNCWLPGQLALDPHLPFIAGQTIVTVERRVSTEELLGMQGGAKLPHYCIDHLALLPGGSYPTSCHPTRTLSTEAVLDYIEATESPAAWAEWLKTAHARHDMEAVHAAR
ncbi:MAG: Ketoacid-CoA transferase [Rhizobacter sp.]|nr:Ketoacid-CoA transferase [Rhizobacter sp.]